LSIAVLQVGFNLLNLHDIFRAKPKPKECRRKVTLGDIHEQNKKIMAKVSELASQFTTLADKVDKVKTEVENLIASLKDVEIPSEAQAALDRLSASITTVDDLNPDATV
jgi:hypothetical protein